jgi:DNA-binding IclR family transcriptional regulator
VERLSRRGSVANRAQVAGRMPIHISSAGLALMASQDKALQGQYLDQFADPDGELIADQVRALLADTARQGFAQLKGVVDTDTWGIAVPVLNRRHRAVASLGVVVPL